MYLYLWKYVTQYIFYFGSKSWKTLCYTAIFNSVRKQHFQALDIHLYLKGDFDGDWQERKKPENTNEYNIIVSSASQFALVEVIILDTKSILHPLSSIWPLLNALLSSTARGVFAVCLVSFFGLIKIGRNDSPTFLPPLALFSLPFTAIWFRFYVTMMLLHPGFPTSVIHNVILSLLLLGNSPNFYLINL